MTDSDHLDPADGGPERPGGWISRSLELQIPIAIGALICYSWGVLIPASSEFAKVYRRGTQLYAAGDIFFLSAPVVAWMIMRGHAWRHALETAAAMMAPGDIPSAGPATRLCKLEHRAFLISLSIGWTPNRIMQRRGVCAGGVALQQRSQNGY